jgi:ParB family chromosome partitioning protein
MELDFHQMAMKNERHRITMPTYHARLMASLAEQGQLNPVLVVESEIEEESGYVLIDGYRRVSALDALGRDTAEALVLPMNESGALLFRHCRENAHRRSALEDGWMLRDLVEQHGMSQAELSRKLERSEGWVSQRLSLVRELPQSVQEFVRRGELCAHLAMRYLVPFARAKKSDCEELARNLSGHRVSTRQMEQIYAQWKCSDKEGRRRVIERPLLYLKSAEELQSASKKEPVDELSRVRDDVEILDAVSNRARRRIRSIEAARRFPKPVVESWKAARSSFAALSRALEQRIDAGQRNKDSDPTPQG